MLKVATAVVIAGTIAGYVWQVSCQNIRLQAELESCKRFGLACSKQLNKEITKPPVVIVKYALPDIPKLKRSWNVPDLR